MAKITLMNGDKFKREPRQVRRLGLIFLDQAAVNVHHAHFLVNRNIIYGLSIDQKNWIEAVKEKGKFVIGGLLKNHNLTEREMGFIDRSELFYY